MLGAAVQSEEVVGSHVEGNRANPAVFTIRGRTHLGPYEASSGKCKIKI